MSSTNDYLKFVKDKIEIFSNTNKIPVKDIDYNSFITFVKSKYPESLNAVKSVCKDMGGLKPIKESLINISDKIDSAECKLSLKEENKRTNALAQSILYEKIYIDKFDSIMSKISDNLNLQKIKPFSSKKDKIKRVITLSLSDLHLGSNLDERESEHKYTFNEEARLLASIVHRVSEFKIDYRNETELVVWLGGDIIQGKLHNPLVGLPLAEQVADATYLLLQAIRYLSAKFPKVTVYCSSGNHDRDESVTSGRPFDKKWSSRVTMVYYAVKLALSHIKNVVINIPRTAYCEWESLGHPFYSTHGDTHFYVGNPGQEVNISKLDRQIKTINLHRINIGAKPYEVFIVGHVHQGLYIPLPAGELIVNPALIPADGYAEGVGFPSTRNGQTVFETTEEHAVGDLRFLQIGKDVYNDSSLEGIISPFKDF